MGNRTPFYERHLALGGKMVDFSGWDMPIQYSTITLEHNAVRNSAGLFDISHMGQVVVWGKDATAYLQFLLTNDFQKAPVGKGTYAHMLNEAGGVIDDVFVYRLEEDRWLVIVNASRKAVDLAWMEKVKRKFDVSLMEAPMAAGLAIQGPKAAAILARWSEAASNLPRHHGGELEIGDTTSFVARTGYTGEDGFEFFGPAGHLLLIWDQLMGRGKGSSPIFKQEGSACLKMGLDPFPLPCGLGARDTLRTEVGYPLYGHELDENHTPLEAGLGWVVKFDKGEFVGRKALLEQKAQGLKNHLCGFKVEEGGVARPGGIINHNGKDIGTVASGTFSPTLSVAIGTAYLPVNVPLEGARLKIRQGPREMSAVTTKLPFLRRTS